MRFLIFLSVLLSGNVFAQVGVNTSTPNSSSLLDIQSTTKGLLVPRLTNTQMNAVTSPATGLTIYNTDASSLYVFNGLTWNSKEDRIAAYANDGVAIQLDNLKIQLSTNTSERSMQIATVSGTIQISGSSSNVYPASSPVTSGGVSGTQTAYTRQTDPFTTSFTTFQPGLSFGLHGSVQTVQLMDETNGQAYSLVLIIGNGFKNNFLSLKRLY